MTPTDAGSTLFLLGASAALILLCRRRSARSSRPWAIWGAGGYLLLLHLVALAGLLSSVAFENGLATLALLTFPFSMSMFETLHMQGFVTPGDLAANYLRYILFFGGLNAALLAGLLTLAIPARDPRRSNGPRRPTSRLRARSSGA